MTATRDPERVADKLAIRDTLVRTAVGWKISHTRVEFHKPAAS